jgi:hypothetical protein
VPVPPRIWQAESHETGTKFPTARVVSLSNTVQTQSNFSGSVLRRVYDLGSATPQTAILSNTATVASVMFNSLQDWDIDDVGFNFRDSVTSNDVGGWEGNHTYRFEYLLPHTSQGNLPVIFDLKIVPMLTV